MMEDHSGRDESDGLEQDSSGSDGSEAEMDSYDDAEQFSQYQYRRLFNDVVVQSRSSVGELSERNVGGQTIDGDKATDEACGFARTGPRHSPEMPDDQECFSCPAEWRTVWDWDVGEHNRILAAQNNVTYDEAECCSDSNGTVDDALEYDLDDLGDSDQGGHCFKVYMPQGHCGLLDAKADEACPAVASSVVVNEPMFSAKSVVNRSSAFSTDDCVGSSADGRGSNSVHRILDDDTCHTMFTEVMDRSNDRKVSWDSGDESGLTELDRDRGRTSRTAEFSLNLAASHSSGGRNLSASNDTWDEVSPEDPCPARDCVPDRAIPTLFSQKPYGVAGVHGRPTDSKWTFAHGAASADDDSGRWKTRKWRQNSTDGLDSAGCSPKDDEDDESDDGAEDSGAAAAKQNKVSPAGGYYNATGSGFYRHTSKDDDWLSKYDGRPHHRASQPDTGSASCDMSDGGYYESRGYEPLRQDGSSSASRTGSDDIRRMMKRKEARRQREQEGFTTADSVAGYRGRDCSIEELIEYIDAKPPAAPKPVQKQNVGRKNRKKKRGSNHMTDWADSDGQPADHSRDSNGTIPAGRTPCNDSTRAASAAPCGNNVGTAKKPATQSAGNDQIGPELAQSELPLRCDTFFQMLPSEGSSSNVSDTTDNILDFVADLSLTDHPLCPIPQPTAVDMAGSLNHDIPVKTEQTPVDQLAIQNSEVCPSPELETSASGCIESLPAGSENYPSIDHAETDGFKASTELGGEDAVVLDEQNCGFSCDDTDAGIANGTSCQTEVSDSCLDGADCIRNAIRRHSDELRPTTAMQHEVVAKPSDAVANSWKVRSVDLGQSTPCSSLSDARDSVDFDCQSWADDVSSDFDFSSRHGSNDCEFTVVTQKKKKKTVRHNTSSADSFQRTFYNRNRYNRQNNSFRQELSAKDPPSFLHSTAPGISAVPEISQPSHRGSHISILPDVVTSSMCEQELAVTMTVVKTETKTSSVACTDNLATTSAGDWISTNSLARSMNSYLVTTNSDPVIQNYLQTAENMQSSSHGCKIYEQVFLDTRRPNAGVASTVPADHLSFWYDVNVAEAHSVSVKTTKSTSEPTANHTTAGDSVISVAVTETTTIVSSPVSSAVQRTDANMGLCSGAAAVSLAISDNSLLSNAAELLPSSHQSVAPTDNGSRLLPPECSTFVPSLPASASDRSNTPCSVVATDSDARRHTVYSGSVTADSRHNGRRRFDLHGAQLFLYNEFRQVISTKCRS